MISPKYLLHVLLLFAPFHVLWAQSGVPVTILPLAKQSIDETVTAWGIVEKDSQYLYFQRGGYLSAIKADTGASVAAGQVLARLDTTSLVNQRQQAQVALNYAQSQLARTKKLKRTDAVGQELLDQITTDYQLKQLALVQIEQDLEKSVLRAPSAGKILRRLIDYPTAIGSNIPVFNFKADTQPWRVTVMLAGRWLHTLHIGDTVTIFPSDFPHVSLSGTIARMAENTENADNLFEVELAVRDIPDFIRAGMQVKVLLKIASHHGYPVPLNVFYRISGQQGMLFMLKQDKAYQVEVQFDFVDGVNAIVTTDLSEFSAIITGGQQHLKQESFVQVVN